jgi:hypothetical protein
VLHAAPLFVSLCLQHYIRYKNGNAPWRSAISRTLNPTIIMAPVRRLPRASSPRVVIPRRPSRRQAQQTNHRTTGPPVSASRRCHSLICRARLSEDYRWTKHFARLDGLEHKRTRQEDFWYAQLHPHRRKPQRRQSLPPYFRIREPRPRLSVFGRVAKAFRQATRFCYGNHRSTFHHALGLVLIGGYLAHNELHRM